MQNLKFSPNIVYNNNITRTKKQNYQFKDELKQKKLDANKCVEMHIIISSKIKIQAHVVSFLP